MGNSLRDSQKKKKKKYPKPQNVRGKKRVPLSRGEEANAMETRTSCVIRAGGFGVRTVRGDEHA